MKNFLLGFLGPDFSSLALVMVIATFCGENGALPCGGSAAAAGRMVKRFLSLGGKLCCRQEAVEIHATPAQVEVTFADGSRRHADYLIAAIDPIITFHQLLRRPLPKALAKQHKDRAMKRFSCLHTAFAVDRAALPFSGDLIFPLSPADRAVLHTKNLILREFSHEPSFAPAGRTVLQTMIFCDEAVARTYIALAKDRPAYAAEKKRLLGATEQAIVNRFPSLNGKLEALDCWTPATYHRFTGAPVGSFMSFTLAKGHGIARLNNRAGCPPRVILATQWQQAPGGLPIAASCGRDAVKTLDEMERQ